jgi:hypothetical protein
MRHPFIGRWRSQRSFKVTSSNQEVEIWLYLVVVIQRKGKSQTWKWTKVEDNKDSANRWNTTRFVKVVPGRQKKVDVSPEIGCVSALDYLIPLSSTSPSCSKNLKFAQARQRAERREPHPRYGNSHAWTARSRRVFVCSSWLRWWCCAEPGHCLGRRQRLGGLFFPLEPVRRAIWSPCRGVSAKLAQQGVSGKAFFSRFTQLMRPDLPPPRPKCWGASRGSRERKVTPASKCSLPAWCTRSNPPRRKTDDLDRRNYSLIWLRIRVNWWRMKGKGVGCDMRCG